MKILDNFTFTLYIITPTQNFTATDESIIWNIKVIIKEYINYENLATQNRVHKIV